MMIHREETPEAVYIHIPFCTNKCHYCDFNSYVLKGQPVMEYLDGLEREMERTVRLVPPRQIKTVFVGGGTPTVLLPDQMESFLRRVRTYFPDTSADLEFSMEANPGTTDKEKLQAMKEGGVNRISFGVQSFDNALLEGIGRIHNTDDVYRSIENARSIGFTNMSIDLMFGLPKQTVELMNDTLDKALALNLPHYSIYSLKVEENTLFHTLYHKNKGVQPYIDATRSGLPILEQYEISEQEAMEDFMMVGLRLLSGVKRADFSKQFGREPESVFGSALSRLTDRKLLERTPEGYRLTEQGVLLGNEVFGEFLSAVTG
ncbi:MAG: coproporphyrinogen oxidase [Paenibacillus sp.]|nr:coproporphyrinogen oxidase [Paenibacillus sp.]